MLDPDYLESYYQKIVFILMANKTLGYASFSSQTSLGDFYFKKGDEWMYILNTVCLLVLINAKISDI